MLEGGEAGGILNWNTGMALFNGLHASGLRAGLTLSGTPPTEYLPKAVAEPTNFLLSIIWGRGSPRERGARVRNRKYSRLST